MVKHARMQDVVQRKAFRYLSVISWLIATFDPKVAISRLSAIIEKILIAIL